MARAAQVRISDDKLWQLREFTLNYKKQLLCICILHLYVTMYRFQKKINK